MNTPAPLLRSNFVTVLAWTMIAFGALSVVMSLCVLVLFEVILPSVDSLALPTTPLDSPTSSLFRIWKLTALPFSLFMTWAAWALFKRRNWARFFHIALFIFTAILHVVMAGALAFGTSVAILPVPSQELVPPELAELQTHFRTAAVVCAVLLLVFAIGYAWLAYRLGTTAIAAEFRDPGATR